MNPDLPPADHPARRGRLRARLADDGLDALWVTSLTNVRWLTGLDASNARLLVATEPGVDLLVTDGRYAAAAAAVAGVEVEVVRRGGDEAAVRRLRGGGGGRLGFEAAHLSWEEGERLRGRAGRAGLDARPTSGVVERLRATKDDHERAALAAACAITDRAFARLLDFLRPGMTERQVATRLEREMVDLGADGPSFPMIVASGPNSAVPHHRPAGRTLIRGDLVKVDFGALYAGYHADMTRTVALGEVDGRLRAVHDLVASAQSAGVAAAVAGASAADVDRACREVISGGGHGDDFVHPSGHGVGLDIHEWPILAEDASATLAAGMTVTVEPGVYLAGVGGVRIEDTVAVRTGGPPEILTRSPRDLITL